MTNTLEIQRRLAALGYSPGPRDGRIGRLTIAAIEAFQKKAGLVVDGIAGPKTVAALNTAGGVSPSLPALEGDIATPWIDNVRPYISLQEVRDHLKLAAYLDSDGSTVGDPRKIPWCGDLVQTPLALTLPREPLPTNPYYALDWVPWGVPVPLGMVPNGAVFVKKRTGGGHVGFVIGHDAAHFHVLAGNQNNSVCIALIAKTALYGTLRWPSTYPLPTRSMPFTTIDATIDATEA